MKKKSLVGTVWALTSVFTIWFGFDGHWSVASWISLGLVLFSGAYSWFCFRWQLRIVKSMASLSPSERASRLAAMSAAEREQILEWIKDNGA